MLVAPASVCLFSVEVSPLFQLTETFNVETLFANIVGWLAGFFGHFQRLLPLLLCQSATDFLTLLASLCWNVWSPLRLDCDVGSPVGRPWATGTGLGNMHPPISCVAGNLSAGAVTAASVWAPPTAP